jgi:hypothetical protein
MVLTVGDDACAIAGAAKGSELAEEYDPARDRWIEVGTLNKPRGVPHLVALPDGTAMVLGGVNEQDEPFSSTKIYSPTDRAWSPGPLMLRADVQATAALADGTIIAVGVESTEILDPAASAWRRSTPPPNVFIEQLLPLADGRVLAIGENDNEARDAAFLTFDPGTTRWSSFTAPAFDRFTELVRLPNDDLLAFGMDESELGLYPSATVMRHKASGDRWVKAASIPAARTDAQIAVMADGRVLVAGGHQQLSDIGDGDVLDSTEIYNSAFDTWVPGPDLLARRQSGYAMTLPDGSVLVYGGHGPWSSPSTPDTGSTDCPPPIAETERLYAVP